MHFRSGSVLAVIKQQLEFHIINHGGNKSHCVSNQSETLEMDIGGFPAVAQIQGGEK